MTGELPKNYLQIEQVIPLILLILKSKQYKKKTKIQTK
jgi:hypothetical protein